MRRASAVGDDGRRGVDGRADRQIDDAVGVRSGALRVRRDGIPGVVGEVSDAHVSAFLTRARAGRQGVDDRVVLVDHADLGGAAGRADVLEPLDVRLVVVLPLVGQVVLVVDRLDGAHRLAGTAVDALVGVDVQHPVTLVDAVDRAFVDAGAVFDIHTRKSDHVRHGLV